MEFKIEQREHPNVSKYTDQDFKLAEQFAKSIKDELKEFVKTVVLFGSVAREEKSSLYERDIDILILVDDLTMILSDEVIQTYRIITEKTAVKVSKRLHITTLKLTTFWEYVRTGDPLIVNMLRDSVPLYDAGFYEPVQMLLFQGRIRPSKEAVWNYYSRAPLTIQNADWHVLQACLDLYWAVIDAAHAALMKTGELPPSPNQVSTLINDVLVLKGLAKSKDAKTMAFFYDLSKQITHRQLRKVSGKEYDEYKKRAEDFIKGMKKIIEI